VADQKIFFIGRSHPKLFSEGEGLKVLSFGEDLGEAILLASPG